MDEKAAEGFQKHHHKDNNNPIILTADLDLTKLLWLSFKVIVMSPGWSRSKGKGIKWDGETLFGLVYKALFVWMLKRKHRFTSGRAKASITNKTALTENEIASINLVKRKVTSLYLNFLTRQGKTGEKKEDKTGLHWQCNTKHCNKE